MKPSVVSNSITETKHSRCVIRGSGVYVPVLFVESTLQHQLLKVDERHRYGDGLQAAVFPEYFHLSLQTETQSQTVYNMVQSFVDDKVCVTASPLKVISVRRRYLRILLRVSLM